MKRKEFDFIMSFGNHCVLVVNDPFEDYLPGRYKIHKKPQTQTDSISSGWPWILESLDGSDLMKNGTEDLLHLSKEGLETFLDNCT